MSPFIFATPNEAFIVNTRQIDYEGEIFSGQKQTKIPSVDQGLYDFCLKQSKPGYEKDKNF